MQKYKLFLKKQNFIEKICVSVAFYGFLCILISTLILTHLKKSILWPFSGDFRHFHPLGGIILPKTKKRL